MKTVVASPNAPKAVGPYSQAIKAGAFLFLAGQIPLDPSSGALVDGDAAAQTRELRHSLVQALGVALDPGDEGATREEPSAGPERPGGRRDLEVRGFWFRSPLFAFYHVQGSAAERHGRREQKDFQSHECLQY